MFFIKKKEKVKKIKNGGIKKKWTIIQKSGMGEVYYNPSPIFGHVGFF